MPEPCKKPCCVEEPCCPQFDRIELSDEESEEEVIELPEPVGNTAEYDLLREAVFGIKDSLLDLETRMTQSNEVISQNMLTLQSNLKMLDDKLTVHDRNINVNTADIRDLKRDMDLLRSEFEQLLLVVGAPEPEFDGLGALEDQIKEAGGL